MNRYRGRFAPSPTGPLHFGSLFAAVTSYLHARYHHGEWLLRIEDIDPPREQIHAKQMILETLRIHGLHWDGQVVYQSDREALYQETLALLAQKNLSYLCPCSRKYLSVHQGRHMPVCERRIPHSHTCACKFRASGKTYHWLDGIQGQQSLAVNEDFVLQRKDRLYAYQLAVVTDDIEQNITHVVRGSDLLDSTPMQLAIYEALEHTPPYFSHFPVIVNPQAQKLSKQNKAAAVDDSNAINNLLAIFKLLGITLLESPASAELALEMAMVHWHTSNIPAALSIQISDKHAPTS